MLKKITVFTPTFNRAYCLNQLYESLLVQTNKHFLWLIIDDGSIDNTQNLVNSWISENKIEIHYIHQENRGMHAAHNTAYQNIITELNVCIDSDDYMPQDAIEQILALWNHNSDGSIAGIIGLDAYKNGVPTGFIPLHFDYATLSELEVQNKIRGDKKIVLRTDIVKKMPLYPLFENEKFVPLGTLYLMIDQKYKYICTNKVLCIIEYLEDGSSKNIFKQYQKSPNGFLYSRVLEMKYSKSIVYSFTRAMHYISSCLFIKKWNLFSGNPKKMLTFFAIPFGVLLHFYILYRIKK